MQWCCHLLCESSFVYFALNVADEIVIMNRGEIILQVDRGDTDRKALQEVFLNLESERS